MGPDSLGRTRSFFSRIKGLVGRPEGLDGLWDQLEEALIEADVGAATTEALIADLRDRQRRGDLQGRPQVEGALRQILAERLGPPSGSGLAFGDGLTLVLIVGVNGVGKTTTAAKLAYHWRESGHRVLLAAADTFRAAGAEQLVLWAERAALPCVAGQRGADPGAVLFDALCSAQARGMDLVVADTAGRFHTKANLMAELGKLRRVAERQAVATHSLLVLDASTGQNGIVQARAFREPAELAGIVVAKLDGTAKGGAVFSIVRELGAPILFAGIGEGIEDLAAFNAERFVAALFDV